MDNQAICIEMVLPAPAHKVWEALTDNEQMNQWYFVLPGFKAETGFEFQFYGGKTQERQYLHTCRVIEVIAGEKLTYSWRYEGYSGNSLVTFELFDIGNRTRLVFTHSGIESFEPLNPDLAKSEFIIGWNYILDVSLRDFLESANTH